MSLLNLDFRITSPIFTSNNKLITIQGSNTIVIYSKEYKPTKILAFPSSVSPTASISFAYYIEGISESGRLYVGTTEGHLLVWTKGNPLLLLHTFPQRPSISCISHLKGTFVAIGLSYKKKNSVKIYPLDDNMLSFENEKSINVSSPLKEIHALSSSSSFIFLSVDHSLFSYSIKDDDIKPKAFLIDKLPKYNSSITRILTINSSILIIGFSSGVIAFYQIEDKKAILLTTLHWHCSPISALAWDRGTKSLFSGASEGVLCHWSSPLSPFLRSSGNEKKDVILKYGRTTRPSMTLPGFGATFLFISLAATGTIAIVTSDNSLRVCRPITSISSSDYDPSSLLFLHKNGPIYSHMKSSVRTDDFCFSFPIITNDLYSDIFILPNNEGAQVVKHTKYSNLLGAMPSGLPRIPNTSSSFIYCTSLIISESKVVMAMKSNNIGCIQLALWGCTDKINETWSFLSSASESYSEKLFLAGPLKEDRDSFIAISSTGLITLWKQKASMIQKQYVLRKADNDGNSVVAISLSFSCDRLILLFRNSWCLIYSLSPTLFDIDDGQYSLKLELFASVSLLKANYDYISFISSSSLFIVGSQQDLIFSLYSINSNTSTELHWSYQSDVKSIAAKIAISVSNKRGLIIGVPDGPLIQWNNPILSPQPSEVIMKRLPINTHSIAFIGNDKYIIRNDSGRLLFHPPVSEMLPIHEEIEDEESYISMVRTRPVAQKLILLAGKGPSVLIDSISTRPSHSLPSPDSLMERAMGAIGLR